MSLSKNKKSPYWQTRFSIDGIRVQESTRCTSQADAKRYEDKRKQEVREQLLFGVKPSKTWFDAKLRWLKEMQHKRSIHGDISRLDWLAPHLDTCHLNEIDKKLIQEIIEIKEKSGSKPATINRILALIRSILNRAHREWEWITTVPIIQLKREDNARIRWITKEEANKLMAYLPAHLKAMAKFTLATGLRQKNVSMLKWMDIDMVKKHLVIHPENNKSGKFLGIPLNIDAIEVLRAQLGKHDTYVFPYRGKPVDRTSTKAWWNALKKAGIEDFHWHDLRHTWASWHVQNGTSLQELMALGGWRDIKMVLRYAHLCSNQLIVAADRISGGKLVERSLKVV